MCHLKTLRAVSDHCMNPPHTQRDKWSQKCLFSVWSAWIVTQMIWGKTRLATNFNSKQKRKVTLITRVTQPKLCSTLCNYPNFFCPKVCVYLNDCLSCNTKSIHWQYNPLKCLFQKPQRICKSVSHSHTHTHTQTHETYTRSCTHRHRHKSFLDLHLK